MVSATSTTVAPRVGRSSSVRSTEWITAGRVARRREPMATRARTTRARPSSSGASSRNTPGEQARLSDVRYEEPIALQSPLRPVSSEALGRLSDGLIGQLERSPVHGHERARAQNLEGGNRLLGPQVLRLHEPRGVVRAYREHRPVDLRKALPDRAEHLLAPRRVARVIARSVAGLVDE